MSIIITGLEMPTERESFNLTIKYNGTVLDMETGMQVAVAYELQSHGRLIDADALMGVIRAHDYPLTAHFNSTDNGMFTLGIQQAVDETPTIIPAEEGET